MEQLGQTNEARGKRPSPHACLRRRRRRRSSRVSHYRLIMRRSPFVVAGENWVNSAWKRVSGISYDSASIEITA